MTNSAHAHTHTHVHTIPPTHNPQWWLCYSLRKHGFGSITQTSTGSALGSPSTIMDKVDAMKALLTASYVDYNTCQFVPVATNTPHFVASYAEAPKQVNCAATKANHGATTGPFSTSCRAVFASTPDSGSSYWDTRVDQVRSGVQTIFLW